MANMNNANGRTAHSSLRNLSMMQGRTRINIGNVNNLINGDNNTIVLPSRGAQESPSNAKEIFAQYPLTESQEHVTLDQKLGIKDKLGRQWKDLGRLLGFGDAELEQMEMEHACKYSEIVYQILTKWGQRFPQQATQSSLALVFQRMKRGDLADLLASRDSS